MRRLFVCVVILGLAVVAFFEFAAVMIADGAYDLEVKVVAPEPIQTIVCQPCQNVAAGEVDLLELQASGHWQVSRDSYGGKTFNVSIPFTHHHSALSGREFHYIQWRALAVVVRYPSGKRVAKVIEIPDGRKSRSITVSLP